MTSDESRRESRALKFEHTPSVEANRDAHERENMRRAVGHVESAAGAGVHRGQRP